MVYRDVGNTPLPSTLPPSFPPSLPPSPPPHLPPINLLPPRPRHLLLLPLRLDGHLEQGPIVSVVLRIDFTGVGGTAGNGGRGSTAGGGVGVEDARLGGGGAGSGFGVLGLLLS